MYELASRAQRLFFDATSEWGRVLQSVRPRPTQIVNVDAWASVDAIVVRARVLARNPAPPPTNLLQRVRRMHARFVTAPRVGVDVEVSAGIDRVRVRSDRRGRVEARLTDGGASEVTLRCGEAPAVRARVLRASSDARRLVVSDIDDTVLDTETRSPLRRVRQLLFSDRRGRLPFEGIATLYRRLTSRGEPLFYVSNAPWQLHAHLRELLAGHELPAGPLLLRDWQSPEPRPHKDVALEAIARDFPGLDLVLIGDTTRGDAEHYVRLAETWPGRVSAIYLHDVRGRLFPQLNLGEIEARARAAHVPLVVVDSVAEIAAHAEAAGWLATEERRAVEARVR